MLVVTVTFEIAPGRMPAFLPLMRAQAQTSLEREPGCHHFDVCVTDDDRSVFLYEIYRDKAAFEAHLQSAHFKTFDASVSSLIQKKEVRHFRLLD